MSSAAAHSSKKTKLFSMMQLVSCDGVMVSVSETIFGFMMHSSSSNTADNLGRLSKDKTRFRFNHIRTETLTKIVGFCTRHMSDNDTNNDTNCSGVNSGPCGKYLSDLCAEDLLELTLAAKQLSIAPLLNLCSAALVKLVGDDTVPPIQMDEAVFAAYDFDEAKVKQGDIPTKKMLASDALRAIFAATMVLYSLLLTGHGLSGRLSRGHKLVYAYSETGHTEEAARRRLVYAYNELSQCEQILIEPVCFTYKHHPLITAEAVAKSSRSQILPDPVPSASPTTSSSSASSTGGAGHVNTVMDRCTTASDNIPMTADRGGSSSESPVRDERCDNNGSGCYASAQCFMCRSLVCAVSFGNEGDPRGSGTRSDDVV